jgi:uncharacterized membrane protein
LWIFFFLWKNALCWKSLLPGYGCSVFLVVVEVVVVVVVVVVVLVVVLVVALVVALVVVLGLPYDVHWQLVVIGMKKM